jgi:hypothetical protein
VPVRVGLDARLETPGFDPFPQRDLGWIGYAMSRPLIELTVRQRAKRYKNITIRAQCRARELVPSPDGNAVSAIRFENSDRRSETLPADLVVEARDEAIFHWDFFNQSASRHPRRPSSGSTSPMLRPSSQSPRCACRLDRRHDIRLAGPGRPRRHNAAIGAEPLDRDSGRTPWGPTARGTGWISDLCETAPHPDHL